MVTPAVTSSCNATTQIPQTVVCSVPSLSLQPNETASASFLITAPSNGSEFNTTVIVTAQGDNDTANNARSELTTISTQATSASGTVDLQVSITQSPAGNVKVGDSIGSNTVVNNAGPDTATGVQCVLTVPFDSQTIGGLEPQGDGNCAQSGQFQYTCTINPLSDGSSVTIGLEHTVPNSTRPGRFETSVSCTSAQTDSDPSDNTADLFTIVVSDTSGAGKLNLALFWLLS